MSPNLRALLIMFLIAGGTSLEFITNTGIFASVAPTSFDDRVLIGAFGAGTRDILDQNVLSNITSTVSVDHMVVIVMENEGLNDTYGWKCGGNCTYITHLANNYGLALNYSDVTHHSLPNYLTLTSGGNYSGPTKGNYFSADCSAFDCFINGTNNNIVDLMEGSGRNWKGYMEDYVGGCKFTDTSGGVPNRTSTDGTFYDGIHNPFIYYSDIRNNNSRCNNILDANPGHTGFLALPSLLLSDLNSQNPPSFLWLTPNACDDGHDSCAPLKNSISQSNRYLSLLVPLILNTTTFRTTNSLLFVTWDEGTSCGAFPSQTYPFCTDRVTTVWAGSAAKTVYKSTIGYSHYSFVTTLEDLWNLGTKLPIPAKIPAPSMIEFVRDNPPSSVGGSIHPIDKLGILAPYIVIAFLILAAITVRQIRPLGSNKKTKLSDQKPVQCVEQ